MKLARILIRACVLTIFAMLASCSHPLEIVGEGDILATGSGGSSCSLQDSPCANLVVADYHPTYTAIPRTGFGFFGWHNCQAPQADKCSFSVAANTVQQFWGQTLPPLRAVFSPEVPLGDLSGDFAASDDCEGTVEAANPEIVFRFRETSPVDGENPKQCLGNTILVDTATGNNYLVWLDILHIDSEGAVIPGDANGSYPIREIFANFATPFIAGKTYTLNGLALSAGPSLVSIEITWVDLDASFNEFAQCIVTTSQSPIGSPTRRKTYCPRFDGSYEIKENIVIGET